MHFMKCLLFICLLEFSNEDNLWNLSDLDRASIENVRDLWTAIYQFAV